VPDVDAPFVAAAGIAGAALGALLDPLGQVLAVRSRAADDRRRVEREQQDADVVGVGHDDLLVDATSEEPDAEPASDGVPAGASSVRHLLPSGSAPARTVAAAAVTSVLWAAAAHRFGSHLVVTPFLVFLALAVAVSVTDLSHRLVPRQLLYGGLALIVPLLVVVSAVDHSWSDFGTAAIGGAAAFAVFFTIWFVVPRGMGFGDVRLSGVIGVTVGYLGLVHVYVAFLSGFVLGLVFGLVLMVGSSEGRKTRIPFAPALCAGAVIAIFWGGSGFHSLFSGS
jgi:prepilin signal peptidase PulO-like enzyme (type II secretory pathway)